MTAGDWVRSTCPASTCPAATVLAWHQTSMLDPAGDAVAVVRCERCQMTGTYAAPLAAPAGTGWHRLEATPTAPVLLPRRTGPPASPLET